MKAAMIPDESLIQEVMSLEDSEEPEMDFAEGENKYLKYGWN